MRTYTPDYVLCGISKYRYAELKAFCQQYGEKKAEAETLLNVESSAEKRERLLQDCKLIENCAHSVDNGRFFSAIIQNVCLGTAYKFLMGVLPTNNRSAFYDARRAFFVCLHESLLNRVIKKAC